MRSLTAQATLSLLWISQVMAIVPRSPFRDSFIFPRQTTVCDSSCAVFTDALNGCTTLGCLCTSAVNRGLQNCVDCAVDANPSADVIANAQDLVGTYSDSCSGFGLPPVTVKSGSGGGPGPSTSSPGRTSVIVTPPSTSGTRTTPVVSNSSIPSLTTPSITISTPTIQTVTDLPLTTIDDTNTSISQSTAHPFTTPTPSLGVTGGPGQGIPGLTGKGTHTHQLASLGVIGSSILLGILLVL